MPAKGVDPDQTASFDRFLIKRYRQSVVFMIVQCLNAFILTGNFAKGARDSLLSTICPTGMKNMCTEPELEDSWSYETLASPITTSEIVLR